MKDMLSELVRLGRVMFKSHKHNKSWMNIQRNKPDDIDIHHIIYETT